MVSKSPWGLSIFHLNLYLMVYAVVCHLWTVNIAHAAPPRTVEIGPFAGFTVAENYYFAKILGRSLTLLSEMNSDCRIQLHDSNVHAFVVDERCENKLLAWIDKSKSEMTFAEAKQFVVATTDFRERRRLRQSSDYNVVDATWYLDEALSSIHDLDTAFNEIDDVSREQLLALSHSRFIGWAESPRDKSQAAQFYYRSSLIAEKTVTLEIMPEVLGVVVRRINFRYDLLSVSRDQIEVDALAIECKKLSGIRLVHSRLRRQKCAYTITASGDYWVGNVFWRDERRETSSIDCFQLRKLYRIAAIKNSTTLSSMRFAVGSGCRHQLAKTLGHKQ
jgi:hypothetical protein